VYAWVIGGKMKKSWILSLFILMICSLFSGCTAGSTTSTVGQETVQPAPIYADQIKDGTYAIEVSSSASMFRIIDAQLTVKDGEMSAVLTLSGTGYQKLYMGTGEEALKDTDDHCIYYVENGEGKYTYEVTVEALNKDIDCAAWSINREQWYDRVLVFQSADRKSVV
jgi:uncharacterized protein with FMN-binding domain